MVMGFTEEAFMNAQRPSDVAKYIRQKCDESPEGYEQPSFGFILHSKQTTFMLSGTEEIYQKLTCLHLFSKFWNVVVGRNYGSDVSFPSKNHVCCLRFHYVIYLRVLFAPRSHIWPSATFQCNSEICMFLSGSQDS